MLTACGGGGETPPGVKVIPVVTLALPSVKVISDDGGNRGEVNEEFLTASDTPAARMQIQATANNAPEPGSVLQRSSNPPRENMFNGERETTQFRKADSDIFSHVGLKNEDDSGTSYVDYFTDYDFAADGDDSDYLVGGIALWVPKDSAITPWIGAAASGNDPFGNASGMGIAAVTGSAMYSGKAHGIASADNVGIENDDTIAITFDADVALTAEFGDDSTGGMISGRVSDFEFSNCEEDCGSGSGAIILKAAPIGDINSGFFTGSTDIVGSSVSSDGTTTTTEIDTIENVGKWGGQFYGNGEDQPGSVAGTFGATIDYSTPDSPDDPTISFLGVFGAYKSSVNNELLTALATPAALTAMQTAADSNPLHGSVSQLSYGTRTFEVIPFIDNDGELSYKTERIRINSGINSASYTQYYDTKFESEPDYELFIDSDIVSTTRFAKDGAFSHVGLKYEYMGEQDGDHGVNETAYIDVFTDYDLTEEGGDTDYLVGGIWLWAPVSEIDFIQRNLTWISVSASGNDPFGNASGMGIAAVTGSATYSGKAHGIAGLDYDYVGKDDETIAFDADVALTAEFGDDSTGGMISGRVSDFDLSNHPKCEGVDCDDAIILKAASIGDSNSGFFTGSTDIVDYSVSSDGTTEIDTTENVGKWGGQFYGNGEDQPGSVAGTFGVTIDYNTPNTPDAPTVSYLGVFGAHKDDE